MFAVKLFLSTVNVRAKDVLTLGWLARQATVFATHTTKCGMKAEGPPKQQKSELKTIIRKRGAKFVFVEKRMKNLRHSCYILWNIFWDSPQPFVGFYRQVIMVAASVTAESWSARSLCD